MTSGNFQLIPITSIFIDRENRQRRELTGIEELAYSIREHGLINPIVVTPEYELVAGERRLTACKSLGFDMVQVQFTDALSKEDLHIIELEENVKREALPWKDHVAAVSEYHAARATTEPGWNQSRTAEALNMDTSQVSRMMLVSRLIDEGVEDVAEAPKFSVAANYAERYQERRKSSSARELLDLGSTDTTSGPPPLEGVLVDAGEGEVDAPLRAPSPAQSRYAEIRQANFLDWSTEVQEEPFNFIHCDFPYGIGAGDKKGQSAAKTHGGYDDGMEVYFTLLETLLKNQDNFIAPSAHMMFWYSMDYHHETVEMISSAGWVVNPFPLIWHKTDNRGILPDKSRGPRRIYETALLCTRGDRKVVKAKANVVGCATTKEFHMSEKAAAMLEHFFLMLVDDSSRVLDPTCGSGMAIRVAEERGAKFSLGLEKSADYVYEAKRNLKLLEPEND